VTWTRKLDHRTRAALELGSQIGATEVLVGLDRPLTADIRRELEAAGLQFLTRDGSVIAGRVPDLASLRQVAEVESVREIQMSQLLRGEE
jgi:hypothetical protein